MKPLLLALSHVPACSPSAEVWAPVDLNHGPRPCHGCARRTRAGSQAGLFAFALALVSHLWHATARQDGENPDSSGALPPTPVLSATLSVCALGPVLARCDLAPSS